jgi:hypothetical protein
MLRLSLWRALSRASAERQFFAEFLEYALRAVGRFHGSAEAVRDDQLHALAAVGTPRALAMSDHICDRKGPPAKVIDESGDEPITCIYPEARARSLHGA